VVLEQLRISSLPRARKAGERLPKRNVCRRILRILLCFCEQALVRGVLIVGRLRAGRGQAAGAEVKFGRIIISSHETRTLSQVQGRRDLGDRMRRSAPMDPAGTHVRRRSQSAGGVPGRSRLGSIQRPRTATNASPGFEHRQLQGSSVCSSIPRVGQSTRRGETRCACTDDDDFDSCDQVQGDDEQSLRKEDEGSHGWREAREQPRPQLGILILHSNPEFSRTKIDEEGGRPRRLDPLTYKRRLA